MFEQSDSASPIFRADPLPAHRFARQAALDWRTLAGIWLVFAHARGATVIRHKRSDRAQGKEFSGQCTNKLAIFTLVRKTLSRDPWAYNRIGT